MINISFEDLKNVVSRLENACKVIENTKSSGISASDIHSAMLTTEKIATFSDYWNKVLRNLLDLKAAAIETKIVEIEQLSEIVAEALCAHQDLLLASEKYQKPVNNDVLSLSRRVTSITQKVGEISKVHSRVQNHCTAVKNGLDTLFWIFEQSGCDNITQTFYESIDFPGNKIFKEKIPEQTKWVKALKAVIKEVFDLVAKNYKNGLVWNGKGDKNMDNLFVSIGATYRENFKKSQSESSDNKNSDLREKLLNDIKDGAKLKPVQKEEKREEVISKSSSTTYSSKDQRGLRKSLHKKGKSEKFEEGRSSFFLENFDNEIKVFDAEKMENKTSILISNSINCTFDVPKKVNKIGLSNCENVKIMVDTLISTFEMTNSKKLEIFIKGTVNSFSIDSTEGVVVHLSQNSKNAQFYTSKASDIIIRIQKNEDSDDYNELVIPEQFVFTINKDRKLEAKISDLYGY